MTKPNLEHRIRTGIIIVAFASAITGIIVGWLLRGLILRGCLI